MRRWKKKILFFILYCVFLLVCCEAAIRLLIYVDSPFKKRLLFLDSNDSSRRLRFIERRTRYGRPERSYNKYDPLRGWALRPDLRGLVVSYTEVINTNSKGIRGIVEYDYEKPEGKKRILVLGDSFTFGVGVKDNETYPYFLQEMLPGAEVINFGVPGYGHDQMLIYLKEEGIKYKPDIVILGFLTGDMPRNIWAFIDYAKPNFKVINGRLTLMNSPVPSVEVMLKKEFYRLKVLDILNAIYKESRWKRGLDADEMYKVTQAMLVEMVKTIKAMGALPVFVYLPDGLDTEDETRDDFFSTFCLSQKVDCLSLRSVFNERLGKGETLRAGPGSHYSIWGNQVIAGEIKGYLAEKTLLDNPAGL
ncbi:MAG: SGNH/GDSL hydrolase family protein [Candidatus Omnitrophota bacterium]